MIYPPRVLIVLMTRAGEQTQAMGFLKFGDGRAWGVARILSPQGLKPSALIWLLAARLKPRPFQTKRSPYPALEKPRRPKQAGESTNSKCASLRLAGRPKAAVPT